MFMSDKFIEFMFGQGPYDEDGDVWFGDNHPDKSGKFWWRKELRDRIASLEAELKQGEWISVDVALPKTSSERVIIRGGCGYYSHKEERWYTCMEQDRGGFYLPIQWEVKHWMKLPEAPQ